MRTRDKSLNQHPNFKGNKYRDCGDYLIGIDSKGEEFKIDKDDYNECKLHCWTSGNTNRECVQGHYFSSRMSRKSPEGHKMKMLHNFIWELHNGKIPKEYRVDHINQNPQDNRLNNLRLANKSENSINNPIHSNNTSGIIGVSWDKAKSSWRVYITYQKKRIELGHTKDKEEAIKKRLQAEKKYFKEFAPQKHLYKQYGIEDDNE